jgi:hypothetical protein
VRGDEEAKDVDDGGPRAEGDTKDSKRVGRT